MNVYNNSFNLYVSTYMFPTYNISTVDTFTRFLSKLVIQVLFILLYWNPRWRTALKIFQFLIR